MTWFSLQMVMLRISLGSLLIFNERTSSSSPTAAAAAGSSRCISEEELNSRTVKLWRTYWDKLGQVYGENLPPRMCAQTAEEMHRDESRRSVSPWRYRLDHDNDRFPPKIAFAECLCKGCIIDQSENLSYNSVPVFAPLMVLRKKRCPGDPDKYVVTKDFIKVSVACTCVVPKYTK